MADNLRFWSALERTDASATKPFQRAGGFRGTATKPIYHIKRMTEVFGPCGVGWGMRQPEFQVVTAEGEILVFCTVALWYMDGQERGEVYGVGGDKVVAQQRSGPFVSDEAFKAAFTDALGNAMKHIGVGADSHMGEFDKYGRDRDDAPPAQQRSAPPLQSPPQSRTAPPAAAGGHLPVSPEEPPHITAARDEDRRHFWARESYTIDPDVIQGGLANWSSEMLAQAQTAPSLDAFLKLKDDSNPHFQRWGKAMQAPVVELFRKNMAAIHDRLANAEKGRAA